MRHETLFKKYIFIRSNTAVSASAQQRSGTAHKYATWDTALKYNAHGSFESDGWPVTRRSQATARLGTRVLVRYGFYGNSSFTGACTAGDPRSLSILAIKNKSVYHQWSTSLRMDRYYRNHNVSEPYYKPVMCSRIVGVNVSLLVCVFCVCVCRRTAFGRTHRLRRP